MAIKPINSYPKGCPKLTAPPLGLTLAGSKSRCLMLAKETALNASLNSQCAICDFWRPLFSKT